MASRGRATAATLGSLMGFPSASYWILPTVLEITTNIPPIAGTRRISETTKNTAASTRNASSRSESSARGGAGGGGGLGRQGTHDGWNGISGHGIAVLPELWIRHA